MNRLACAALITLVWAGTVAAQTPPRRYGLGMTIAIDGPANTAGILVPINIAPRRRLEPEVAFSKTTFDQGVSRVEAQTTLLSLGLLFFLPEREGATRLYIGPRVGAAFTKIAFEDAFGGSGESKRWDWFGRFVAGGEHMFSPHFSIGAEARLTYYKAGDPEGSASTFQPSDSHGTGAAAFIRWYF